MGLTSLAFAPKWMGVQFKKTEDIKFKILFSLFFPENSPKYASVKSSDTYFKSGLIFRAHIGKQDSIGIYLSPRLNPDLFAQKPISFGTLGTTCVKAQQNIWKKE